MRSVFKEHRQNQMEGASDVQTSNRRHARKSTDEIDIPNRLRSSIIMRRTQIVKKGQ